MKVCVCVTVRNKCYWKSIFTVEVTSCFDKKIITRVYMATTILITMKVKYVV